MSAERVRDEDPEVDPRSRAWGLPTRRRDDLLELKVAHGRPVRLRYAVDGPRLFVAPSRADADWFARAIRSGTARVRAIGGAEVECAATAVFRPEEIERVASLLREKYGDVAFARWFGRLSRALALEPGRPPVPVSPDELLRDEFDSVAPFYEDSIGAHGIDRYLKVRVAERLGLLFEGLDPLLEIGPGTGYHTLRLRKAGHHLFAVDVSPRMLEELGRRAAGKGGGAGLETRVGRFRDLEALLSDLPDGAFAGGFSAFGAFNLEPEIDRAIPSLYRLLRPGGRLAFTSLNRPGVSPLGWELAMGRPGAAFRRVSEVVEAGGIRYPLELYLRSPSAWDRLLAPGFRPLSREAVSVAAPPFDSDRLVRWVGTRGGERAKALDGRLSRWPGSWVAAEWVLLTYERTGRDPPHGHRA